MSDDDTVRHRFDILCRITRAQHFAWRDAVAEAVPEDRVPQLVERMWQKSGEQTGRSYAQRVKRSLPLAPQVAESFAWSSRCMGEDASVELGKGDEAFVRHDHCPWFEWHKRRHLLSEDRPGCDAWFRATVDCINRELGTTLEVETLQTLPDGDSCCRRRIRVS